jgi:hypothetical protein
LLDSFIMYSLLTTLYQELKTIKHPMKWWSMNEEVVRVWKEVVMT